VPPGSSCLTVRAQRHVQNHPPVWGESGFTQKRGERPRAQEREGPTPLNLNGVQTTRGWWWGGEVTAAQWFVVWRRAAVGNVNPPGAGGRWGWVTRHRTRPAANDGSRYGNPTPRSATTVRSGPTYIAGNGLQTGYAPKRPGRHTTMNNSMFKNHPVAANSRRVWRGTNHARH